MVFSGKVGTKQAVRMLTFVPYLKTLAEFKKLDLRLVWQIMQGSRTKNL